MKALKSNRIFRSVVSLLRSMQRSTRIAIACRTRKLVDIHQERLGTTSEFFGIPRKIVKDVFYYRYYREQLGLPENCKITIHEPEKLVTLPEPITLEKYRYPNMRVQHLELPCYAAEVTNGRVFSPYGAIITEDDVYLEFESHEHMSNERNGLEIQKYSSLPTPELFDGRLGVGACISVINYSHLLTDCLPKILQCEMAGVDKFFVNHLNTRYQNEIFEMVGLSEEKIIRAQPRTHVKAKQLVFGAFPGPYGYIPAWGTKLVRERLLPFADAGGPKKIFISREDANDRPILNEKEIAAYLEKEGFVKVVASKLTVKQQITMFANADFIIGPHGAANTNIIFSKPGCRFLEIFHPNYVKLAFFRISHHNSLRYGYLLGDAEFQLPFDGIPDPTQTMTISLSKLQSSIELLQNA